MEPATVLIADDDSAIRTVLTQAFGRAGYHVAATGNAATLWRWVAEGEGDAVITDVVLPDESGFDLLPRMKKARPTLPVLVMSAKNTIMTAITAAERGAYDYLPKPFDLNDLIASDRAGDRTFARASAPAAAAAEAACRRQPADRRPLAGDAGDLPRSSRRITQTDLTVMIIGEAAPARSWWRGRCTTSASAAAGPFVAVNMAAIPRELIESRALRP